MGALRDLKDNPFELLLQFEERVRAAKLDIVAGQAQFWVGLGFRMDVRWLVTPRDEVREVITMPTLARVPGARPWLLGVANVRGGLLPVCDLRRLVGGDHQPLTRNSRVLVYNSDRIPAGFLVDEVAGYRQFVPGEQRPELIPEAGLFQPYSLGAFVRDGQAWYALSLHKLVQSDTFKHSGF